MRTIINPIVVEGLSDKNVILSFFDACIYLTKGNDINDNLLYFLNDISLPAIILVDSDSQGKIIRDRLHSKLKNYIDLETDINSCNYHNKHGVAECHREDLVKLLKPYSHDLDKQIDFSNRYLDNVEEINVLKNKYNLTTLSKKDLVVCLKTLQLDKNYGNK